MGSIGLKYVSANERCGPLLGRFYDYQKSWMYFLNVKAHLKSQRTVHGVNEEEKSALGIEHKKPQHSNTVDRTIHWGKIHPIISGLTKAEGLFGCLTWQQSHQCSPNKPQLALQVCFARVENNPFLEYCWNVFPYFTLRCFYHTGKSHSQHRELGSGQRGTVASWYNEATRN